MFWKLALAAALVCASPASAFLATNGMRVEQRGPTDFVVPFSGQSAARAFWCAAAEFGARRLDLAPGARIYRASEPPRRSGEGIAFTLDPRRAAASTGTIKLGGPPAAYTVAHARLFCNTQIYGGRG